ncbi:MAG TPA: FHA domain-containing protein [Gemmatimonadaceae bacterium]|nr:FHA domain-containing protein [Gemmatimonadaceae bacterium]
MDIALVIVVLLLFVVGPVVVVNRDLLFNRSAIKRKQYSEPPLPFLIIPTSPGEPAIDPVGTLPRRAAAPRASARQSVAEAEAEADDEEPTQTNAAVADVLSEQLFEQPPESYDDYDEFDDETLMEPPEPRAQRAPEPRRAEPIRVAPLADVRGGIEEADDMDEPAPDATVVFHRPMDEAVQILPGRLHVLSGEAAGKDFRLVSRIGEPPHIVVGRETGPPYRHITLEAPTVSRRHARMDFVDGHWTITNLSKTNPVLVNNRALLNGGTARKLANGDCIELGEVALRFLAS